MKECQIIDSQFTLVSATHKKENKKNKHCSINPLFFDVFFDALEAIQISSGDLDNSMPWPDGFKYKGHPYLDGFKKFLSILTACVFGTTKR